MSNKLKFEVKIQFTIEDAENHSDDDSDCLEHHLKNWLNEVQLPKLQEPNIGETFEVLEVKLVDREPIV